MEGGRGRRVDLEDRQKVVSDILEARNLGCKTAVACEVAGISKRTFERWQTNNVGDKRKGPLTKPANKLADEEYQKIVEIVNSEKYRDKSPAQIVPLLADTGEYVASESSFYRILKAEKLDAHRQKSNPAERKKPLELVATKPNQIYSWDITYLQSNIRGMFFFLYLFMDVYSRKIVGFTVENEQNAEHAANAMTKICEIENVKKGQVTLHSDNGGPMKGATMLARLQMLGIMPSFSRPSVSNDNPYSESLFKTLKYCPQYPSKPFESKDKASEWVQEFVSWYNEEHLHSAISFVTPSSRHSETDIELLENRHEVYQRAKALNPNRWSRSTRNWGYIEKVNLNKLNKKESSCNKKAA